jgi:hypothetical protein
LESVAAGVFAFPVAFRFPGEVCAAGDEALLRGIEDSAAVASFIFMDGLRTRVLVRRFIDIVDRGVNSIAMWKN